MRKLVTLAALATIVLLAATPAVAAEGSTGTPYDDVGSRLFEPVATLSAHDCTTNASNLVTNCSFEAGFTGWTAVDMANPLVPLSVVPANDPVGWPAPFVISLLFGDFPVLAIPTQGGFVAGHGFDGGGPDSIVLSQSVALTGGDCELRFDYRGGWDMTSFASQPRTFTVSVGDFSRDLLTAQPWTVGDTLLSNLDAGLPGSGSAVLTIPGCGTAAGPADLVFEWFIPEAFTGPAAFMLDNVELVCDPTPSDCGDAVADIATLIAGIGLDPTLEGDLQDIVANAIDKLDKGNVTAAISQLRILLEEIEKALLDGDISAADASELFSAVIAVLAGLA